MTRGIGVVRGSGKLPRWSPDDRSHPSLSCAHCPHHPAAAPPALPPARPGSAASPTLAPPDPRQPAASAARSAQSTTAKVARPSGPSKPSTSPRGVAARRRPQLRRPRTLGRLPPSRCRSRKRRKKSGDKKTTDRAPTTPLLRPLLDRQIPTVRTVALTARCGGWRWISRWSCRLGGEETSSSGLPTP